MATQYGIDVSVHNGTVDMAKVKASGKSFVMIRSGYGDILTYPNQKDSRFEANYKAAKAAGLNVGIYHYMYATTVAGAKREAQGFIQTIKGKTSLEMPVALDIEEQAQYNLSTATVDSIITAFISEVEAAGYYCMLYSYEAFLAAKVSAAVRNKYDIWCANISRSPSIAHGIHQHSFTGSVSGVSGAVDLNRTDRDYPAIIKGAGLNGYTKPTVATKTLDTSGFKKGDKDLGVYFLKRRLKALGYNVDDTIGFGNGTEKAVNKELAKAGYEPNGIAGKGFADIIMK